MLVGREQIRIKFVPTIYWSSEGQKNFQKKTHKELLKVVWFYLRALLSIDVKIHKKEILFCKKFWSLRFLEIKDVEGLNGEGYKDWSGKH